MSAPTLNKPLDDCHIHDGNQREMLHEVVAQVGSLPDQLALSLLGLYRDAVSSPRSPAPEVLKDLAKCFAGVTVRLVPRLVSWKLSGLARVFV